MLQNSNAIEDGGYVIERSLVFDSFSANQLTKTYTTAPTNNKIFTLSFWIKRGIISSGTEQWLFSSTTSNRFGVYISSSDALSIEYSGTPIYLQATQKFRDVGAHSHVVIAIDSTQAIDTNRAKIYINGNLVTTFGTQQYPAQNAIFDWLASGQVCRIGNIFSAGGNRIYDGYISEIHVIDGQSLSANSFGEINSITGQWVAKKYTGTYGNNGFYLDFKDGTSTTTLGQDKSGNNNNWVLNNFTRSVGVSDCWMRDTPTNNFATFNPLSLATTGDVLASHSNGNLVGSDAGNVSFNSGSVSTIAVTSGKWVCEQTMLNQFEQPFIAYGNHYANPISTGVYYYGANGQIYKNTISIGTFATFGADDVIRLELDADNKIITFFKNNILVTSTTYITTNPVYFGCQYANTSGGASFANFGQREFSGTPTAGFKSLCVSNLYLPSIRKPKEHFDVITYTGNGLTNRSISGLNFSPDLVWIKHRSGAISHGLWNSNVGGGVNTGLASDRAVGEPSAGFDDTNGYLTTFDSNGFSVKTGVYTNNNTTPYVAWQWRASDLPAVTNNVGSISSQVSVNTASGFSIVSYTGNSLNSTVGHGLGIMPKVIISKSRNNASVETGNWFVWHASAGTDFFLRLNTTDAKTSISGSGGGTYVDPTSSVFTTAFISGSNIVSNNYIAYCFAEIQGYSKFGSYTGNGSVNGSFVYTGFRPAFVLIKCIDTAGRSWDLFDKSRSGYNVDNDCLFANLSNAENTGDFLDLTSNGFKLRTTDTFVNASGSSYIFLAFAETPFQYSNAR